MFPVDNFGTVVGENPDCLLLSGTVVGENPDHVCWVTIRYKVNNNMSATVYESLQNLWKGIWKIYFP